MPRRLHHGKHLLGIRPRLWVIDLPTSVSERSRATAILPGGIAHRATSAISAEPQALRIMAIVTSMSAPCTYSQNQILAVFPPCESGCERVIRTRPFLVRDTFGGMLIVRAVGGIILKQSGRSSQSSTSYSPKQTAQLEVAALRRRGDRKDPRVRDTVLFSYWIRDLLDIILDTGHWTLDRGSRRSYDSRAGRHSSAVRQYLKRQ